MSYASNTSVSPEKSQEHIKSTLRRYGAERFGVMEETAKAYVLFTVNGLNVRIEVPLPKPSDAEFTQTDTGRERGEAAAYRAYEQAVKSRWRALLLAIKAKLEAVECGISTIEVEFMPFVVMGDGRTVSDHLLPELQKHAAVGRMPSHLLLEANG